MKSYVFAYDVSFPVLVTITDPDAFEGRGYDFIFALEGNIRGDKPLLPDFTETSFADPVRESLACNDNQRSSTPIKLTVEDAITGEPIEDAMVEFMMANQACYIGKTTIDENGEATLTAQYPIGVGSLKVSKRGYPLYNKRYTTYVSREHEQIEKKVLLYPEIEINASIRGVQLSYDMNAQDYLLPRGVSDVSISPNEQAFLTFTRVSEDGVDEFDYSTYLLFKGDQVGTTPFKIVPGTYEVMGGIMKDEVHTIPRETTTYEVPFGEDQTIVANETKLENYIIGGVEFDNETGYLVLDAQDLLGSRQVIFYEIRLQRPITHSQEFKNAASLEEVAKIKDYSSLYREALEPRYLRAE